MPTLWEQLSGARVYDLGQPYFTGMPHWPAHPPFLFGLTKRHGDMVGPADRLVAALPQASLVTLPGVDHFSTPSDFGAIDATMRFFGMG